MVSNQTGTTGLPGRPHTRMLALGVALILSGPVLLLTAIVLQAWEMSSAGLKQGSHLGLLAYDAALFGGAPLSAVGGLVLVHWARTRRRGVGEGSQTRF